MADGAHVGRVATGISVSELVDAGEGTLPRVVHLVGQLSTSAKPLTAADLAAIVASPASCLLVARDATGDLVGMLTLVSFRIPTGVRALVEDVVVDGAHRRQGVAEALTTAALEHARRAGARSVDLTSRPSRQAANRLYQRLGFVRRETNVYRYDLG